jgi:carbon starvation protein
MSRTAWIIFIAVYIAIASLVPVWILLQPRDYLSSYLLYAMMILAVIGIFSTAVTGRAEFTIPAVTGWNSSIGPMFPALFVTVACGACSGFHALIASGTTSKQLDNEKHAQPIAYGSMLIESGLGIIALVALGAVYEKYVSGGFGSPTAAFAAGIAVMFSDEGTVAYSRIYAMLTLAVSVFALTSLDTATRLSRFMFAELFLREGETSWKEVRGPRRILTNPLFATAFMVIIGSILGGMSLSAIWALFGAANQLLAGIALLAVCCWLGEVGKNNRMFYFPMAFMLCATITMLIMRINSCIQTIASGYANIATPVWGVWFQLIFAIVMVILAVFLVVEAVNAFRAQAARKKAAKNA